MPLKHFILLIIAAILTAALPASAHPRKEAEIEISFNEHTGKVEIIHRYRLTDAEQALQAVYGAGLDLMADPAAQAQFGAYIEDSFALKGQSPDLHLTLVGGEIDQGSVWIYQESDPLPEDGLFLLRNTALMETFPSQVNIVNVRLYGDVQTFLLTRSMPWVAFRLDGSAVY